MCRRSCNWVSGWGLKTSTFILICDTDVLNAFDKSLFACILGSSSAEGGWAVNLAASFSWTWTLWEMTASPYELYITWHKMAFSLLFTNGAIPSQRLYTSQVKFIPEFMLIEAEISCISTKTVLAASWRWLTISPCDKLIAHRRLMIWT